MVKVVADFCEASFLALIAEKAVLVKAFPFCKYFESPARKLYNLNFE